MAKRGAFFCTICLQQNLYSTFPEYVVDSARKNAAAVPEPRCYFIKTRRLLQATSTFDDDQFKRMDFSNERVRCYFGLKHQGSPLSLLKKENSEINWLSS